MSLHEVEMVKKNGLVNPSSSAIEIAGADAHSSLKIQNSLLVPGSKKESSNSDGASFYTAQEGRSAMGRTNRKTETDY